MSVDRKISSWTRYTTRPQQLPGIGGHSLGKIRGPASRELRGHSPSGQLPPSNRGSKPLPCQQHLTTLAGTVCFLLAGWVPVEGDRMDGSQCPAGLSLAPPLQQGSRGPVSFPSCTPHLCIPLWTIAALCLAGLRGAPRERVLRGPPQLQLAT